MNTVAPAVNVTGYEEMAFVETRKKKNANCGCVAKKETF